MFFQIRYKVTTNFAHMQTFGYFFAKNRIYSIILCTRMALDACIRKASSGIK